jgi:hypothetical protein
MKMINEYFNAEKFESLFVMGVGLIAILLGIYFWFSLKEPFYRGIAIPFVLVGLIQIVVGTTVYFRSPKDIIRVENILKNEPAKIQSEEIPRMEVVMNNFVIYRYVEIALVLVGIFLYFFFAKSPFWKGIGLGLMIQAGLMLTLDYFAEKRGKAYQQFLIELGKK